MEEVLDVYTRPHNPARPLVCLDESSKQLIAHTRTPLPTKPGYPARHDHEYRRAGTANLFMLFAPLEGWRHVEVTRTRKAVDYAHILKTLSDVHFPEAECAACLLYKITLVQECVACLLYNLNIHAKASLYKAFAPKEARRLVRRFEWIYTPKHGSWLNMAEIELAVLARQCLARRVPDERKLKTEVGAWYKNRNKVHAKADWRFKNKNARIKLKHLYPAL